MRSAVFLDRDGVLNRLVQRDGRWVSPRNLSEFQLLPGIEVAVEVLRRAGLLIIVVTNQPDIARGFLTLAELERMHGRLRESIHVDAIYICTHDDADGCDCRKPKPGLLLRASQELEISLPASYLVGDNWKDIEAGESAGCKTFFVQTRTGNSGVKDCHFTVPDIQAAAELIAREVVSQGGN